MYERLDLHMCDTVADSQITAYCLPMISSMADCLHRKAWLYLPVSTNGIIHMLSAVRYSP